MGRRSDQIGMLFRQGRQLHAAGRLAEAEQLYRQVIAAMPRHADAIHAMAALALQAGQPGLAETLLDHAIGLKPAADFQITRCHALLALHRPDEAVRAARLVLRARPHSAEAHQLLGHALSDSGQPEPAIEAYRTALRLRPALPDIRNNLGTALRQAGRLAEAEQELRLAPPEHGSLVNLSSVQKELGAFADAEATLRQALSIAPDDPVLRYNRSLLLLLLGRMQEGWAGWEDRFHAGAVAVRTFAQPQWRGEPLDGRTLLVHSEQGLGDAIQFCRYLPTLRADPGGVEETPRRGQVIFEVPPRLIGLLSSNPALSPMVPAGASLPDFDVVTPLLSLPARITLPAADPPYLFAEADRIAAWKNRIGAWGWRVGINWQGFSGRFEDKGRSLPLAALHPLAAVPGVRLISLQKGEGEEQVTSAGFPVETLDSLDAGADAFVDTAAVMATLHLVITSDTSIAHLAGALGHPVWVALRRVPDWRWMLDRADSPWYPTMRLFRQTGDGDWSAVLNSMAAALRSLTAGALDPVAWPDERAPRDPR